MTETKILFIDDDLKEAERQKVFMSQDWADVEIIIKHPDEYSSIAEITDYIDEENCSIVIFDHRLSEQSKHNFTGLELAEAVRHRFPIKPLFILTKFAQADDLEEKGFSVDDVMDKTSMRKHPETYIGRLQRAAQRYFEYVDDLQKRLQELIVVSLDRELSDSEVIEMREIRSKLLGHTIEKQVERTQEAKTYLEQQKSDIQELKKLLGKD